MRRATGTAALGLLLLLSACSFGGDAVTCETVEINPRTQNCTDGPTPAGGAYAVGTYLDENGEPVPKDEATQLEIIEYDEDGNELQSTLGTL